MWICYIDGVQQAAFEDMYDARGWCWDHEGSTYEYMMIQEWNDRKTYEEMGWEWKD